VSGPDESASVLSGRGTGGPWAPSVTGRHRGYGRPRGAFGEYRQTHRIPMAELRAFIDQMRSQFGVPYPLADQRPFASGKELLSVAQDAADLNADLCLVATVRGQYVLTPAFTSASRGRATRRSLGVPMTTRCPLSLCGPACVPGGPR
jgi:hypothetical protein